MNNNSKLQTTGKLTELIDINFGKYNYRQFV